ncbi:MULTISPECIES: hypothetical protein [Lysobacter]|uniref:Cthe-2314-like HEPN domain-containing protein n=1 Tax=Lysobacter firmicutimachus TaxID=1792846 RepID=A0ABU8D4P9_9GAMM|nr:hypothetical protein [Lysobacter antibioticus]
MSDVTHQYVPKIESSGDHWSLEFAVRARWAEYEKLRFSWENFAPEPVDLIRARVIASYLPQVEQDDSLREFVEGQIRMAAEPAFQRTSALGESVLSEYVTSLLLSHSLCEAIINDVVATKLASLGSYEIFAFVERATFLEKWSSAPKLWADGYSFPKGGALYESLKFINEERNAYTHHKVALTLDGRRISERKVRRQSIPNMLDWIHRYLSLPYDLADLLWRTLKIPGMRYFLMGKPIRRCPMHAKDLPGEGG